MTKVGITCGSFDYYIHDGHRLFLNLCNQLCDYFYIALVTDSVIIENKKRQPYFSQQTRARNLLNTGLVDNVILQNGNKDDIYELLLYLPDIYIIGKDQNDNNWTKETIKFLYDSGISIVSIFEKRINSTTRLLYEIGYIS